ncbi:hypothetical protein C8R44DRAFT_872629 [Mycena epipterygia]|nr:hypothetical protein C8R44DRAFT_872629 [Mycena epipterygia]
MCPEWFEVDDGIGGQMMKDICTFWMKHSCDPNFPLRCTLDGHISHLGLEVVDEAIVTDDSASYYLHLTPPTHYSPSMWERSVPNWRKRCVEQIPTGRYPQLTPEIFTAERFAPGISSSTQLHLPDDYPIIPPSSSIDADDVDTDVFTADVPSTFLSRQSTIPAISASAASSTRLNLIDRRFTTQPSTIKPYRNPSAPGRVLTVAKNDAQLQKNAVDDANREKRDLVESARTVRRSQLGRTDLIFTGTINAMKLGPLQDLAWSLELDEGGKLDVIITRVMAHFRDRRQRASQEEYALRWSLTKWLLVSSLVLAPAIPVQFPGLA